jgi:hypothetical protein
MKWLFQLAEKVAHYVIRKAQTNSNISAREFDAWKREYKQDFGKDFKEKNT